MVKSRYYGGCFFKEISKNKVVYPLMSYLRTILLLCTVLVAEVPSASAADEIVQVLFETTFDENTDNRDWRAEHGCRISVKGDLLHVEALQDLPQLSRVADYTGGEFRLIVELRTGIESDMAFYWMRRGTLRRDENHRIQTRLYEDGDWHSYEFVFSVPDVLTSMMLRFSAPDGTWDIRSIKLIRKSPPPLSVREVTPHLHKDHEGTEREGLRFTVANELFVTMPYRIGQQTTSRTLQRNDTVDLWAPINPVGNLSAVVLTLHPQGFPSQVYPVFLYRPEGETDWIQKPVGNDCSIDIAPDARMARLWRGGELFGIIAPLVHRGGAIPQFVLANDSTESELHFESDEVDLRISIASAQLNFEITDKLEQGTESVPLEGPVVRLFGTLQSGLLPGVEFLQAGDTSSSERDIERPHNNRSKPNPLWMTMPLAVLETEKGGAALYWEDSSLQPTFSSPNRFDRTSDHRVSLIGSRIKATLELLSPELLSPTRPSEQSASFRVLRSYIARKGFPSPPPPLRMAVEQRQLFVQALAGGLQSEMGGQWGYAIASHWERKPFADMISTSARLTEATGERVRNPNVLVSGGSDITNDAIYFLLGRIPEWQQQRESAIQQMRGTHNADGSFLFRTRFPQLETAASSYGFTALQALAMMEYVRVTGNNELFAMVTKALEFLESCGIPSGGFYRDTPFGTPDLQAAATLVWLYVWAYEYSGNVAYLERAKHFAFAGLPFVYQTASKEHMLYGTVGKFGGTNRRLPMHFGVLSPQVGIQYAYALNLLSRHDNETDWKTVARGILHAAENLQYTEGMEAGCVPELFDVVQQERRGDKVNPCALVSLRWAVDGKVDSLFVLTDGRDRYTAPYPLRKTSEGIEAYDVPSGQRFHILRNARRYGTGEGNGLITVD